eukprot:COSAG02_NODE_1251_length_13599_cov_13.573259_7_plen_64_part_00
MFVIRSNSVSLTSEFGGSSRKIASLINGRGAPRRWGLLPSPPSRLILRCLTQTRIFGSCKKMC